LVAKNSPSLEASKRLLEKKLSNKTREQLYHDIFNTSPPKRPKQVEASLMINETTDGAMEIIFTDDHLDFSIPAAPVMKILSKIAVSDILKTVRAAIDSQGRITQSALTSLGLRTTFDSQLYQVKIIVPSIFLLKQLHQLIGIQENPYSIETIKPNVVSAFLNIQADQKIRYNQSLSNNSISNQSLESENNEKKFSRPFTGNFDGAVNAKGVVLEGMANYQQYIDHPFQRKDVRLVYDRPEQALRFSAGDIQYLTLGYQSSVRMGGVSISKDYSLQPYILTYPIGEHEFYLTDPAEAEIWVDEVMVSKMVLEPGTHDIRGFPFSMGNNHVKIVLKDFAGRTDTIAFSFQYNTTLLTKGYSRFSFNAGFPSPIVDERYRYNQDQPCLSLAYQRGISDKLTLDLYSQAFTSEINTRTFSSIVDTNTLFSKSYKLSRSREGMLGFGGLYAIPSGFIDLDAAGSYIKNRGPGSALRLGYTYETMVSYKNSEQAHPSAFKLSTPLVWNTQAEYLSPKFLRSPVDSPYNYLEVLKFSTDLTAPLSERFTVSTGAKYYFRRDTTNLFEIMLRLQKTWLNNLSAGLTFQFTTDIYGGEANPAVLLNLNWMFRSGVHEISVNEAINRHPPDNSAQSITPSQTSQTTQTSQASSPQWDFNTGFQWNYDDFKPRPERVLATVNAQLGPQNNDYSGLVGYSGNQGTIELTQDMDQPENSGADYLRHQTDLILKTALVYAGKTVCFSRPVYSGGFVLAKGVKNLADNKILVNPSDQGYDATTNAFGPAVLPLYSPYQIKRIKVEPENPPMGFVNEKSSFTLFPHYKSGFSLELGSEKSVLVLGTVQDFDGSPFGYQSITIIAVNDKKAAPVLTFTNGIGRFQFLGHEKQMYKIMPPQSSDRIPIMFVIPKNMKGFYQAGVMIFLQTGNPIVPVKADTVRADTARPDTAKPDTAKNKEIKPDTIKTLNETTDTTKNPWITVLGSLASRKGKTLVSTSIFISSLDSNQAGPLNTINSPLTVTTDHGLFNFDCRRSGNYMITVASGPNKGASVSFYVPLAIKGSFNIGNMRVK
jgi:outer membrane usher protein